MKRSFINQLHIDNLSMNEASGWYIIVGEVTSMKYCMKCGTLLEDSHENCIGCGADVKEPGTWSLYPPEMAKVIEKEKKEKKSRTGLIIALIVVFVLLIASIVFFIILTAASTQESTSETIEEKTEEVVLESVEETVPMAEEAEDEIETLGPVKLNEGNSDTTQETEQSEREVKDSEGKYYNVGNVNDDAGNLMFTTLYPEDFSELGAGIAYDICSTKFPESVTYIVGNEDGNVRLTYMSPQHYWYRKSDGRQSRTNERNVLSYMQFFTYGGAQGYIEAMIKDSYSDIKNFKLISKEEYSPNISSKLSDVSNLQTNYLLGDIGDYAKIASDTVYAAMAAECEAYIYHYEATSRQNNTIYMDFYVPVMANTLGYVTEYENDKGEVTEWLVPEFIAFEAGNEELHNMYQDAFKVFIANSRLTEEFFYVNKTFSEEIEAAISVKKDLIKSPILLDKTKLTSIHSTYKPGCELTQYGQGVYDFLGTNPATYTTFTGEMAIAGDENSKVAFYSKDKNKVFISPAEDEYPGSDYVDLEAHEGSSESSEELSDSEES